MLQLPRTFSCTRRIPSANLGRIYLSRAEFRKIYTPGKQFIAQLFQVVDLAHRYDRKRSQMGTQHNGLRIIIANDSNPRVAGKFTQLVLKLVAKVTVLNPVNTPLYDSLLVHGRKAGTFGTHMRMIISAIKKRIRTWRL